MRQLLFAVLIIQLCSCTQQVDNTTALQHRIDSLEIKLANTYKPGLGELMSGIQAHHAKLWFAAQNENWELADFEVHEIMETIEDIQKFETDRNETQLIGMINPALDSVNNAIEQKNVPLFKRSYTLLTNTCNDCHSTAKFEFNVVKIPDIPTFSNQDFKLRVQK